MHRVCLNSQGLPANCFHRFVISDNTIEPERPMTQAAILTDIIPKMPARVITLEQAIAALQG
jgi:hypothetical protein